MRKLFGDSSILIHYIQQMLYENYNSKVNVSGEYYKHFDMNYGFAHFIAKYLDYKYPLLDKESISEYSNYAKTESGTEIIRSLKQPISLMNYFLSDNKSNRLRYNIGNVYTDSQPTNIDLIYESIYNEYMILKEAVPSPIPRNKNYIVKNDLPLFSFYGYNEERDTYEYSVNNNIIFTLEPWGVEKDICEIDNFVASYLVGRTITPQSSMEDIYYVQKLLIRSRNITREEKGVWCIPGYEGTEYDLTTTIINYQSNNFDYLNDRPLFVTGYFDIFTEACALKEIGGDSNGILGL